jgi:outer membrane protein
VRGRVVYLDTANKSDPIPALAVPGDAIHVSNKGIPEVDITYFLTKNIAAELVLTYPQRHSVTVTSSAVGAFESGSFKHLPPTLMLQYHFNPEGRIRPYAGVGVNYTLISNVSLLVPVVNIPLKLESSSVGFAAGAGADIKLDGRWYLNVDVKKVQIRSDVINGLNGVKLSAVKVDPWLFGLGIGYRF